MRTKKHTEHYNPTFSLQNILSSLIFYTCGENDPKLSYTPPILLDPSSTRTKPKTKSIPMESLKNFEGKNNSLLNTCHLNGENHMS